MNVYLVKTKQGEYGGYTYDKRIAKAYRKQRKGSSYIKVDEKAANSYLWDNDKELISWWDTDYIISIEEEAYFIEAFDQYIGESVTYANTFLKLLTYTKYTDKEKKTIQPLVKILLRYIHDYEHDTMFDEDGYDYNEYFNMENCIRIFLKHVLEVYTVKDKEAMFPSRKHSGYPF